MSEFQTYDEAAAILGISSEAVRCRAKRGNWRRSVGNDGKARIMIPDGIDRARPPVDRPNATGQRPGDDRVKLAELETEIRLLREMLADMRQDRDHWRQTADRLIEQAVIKAAPATAVTDILDRMRAKRTAA